MTGLDVFMLGIYLGLWHGLGIMVCVFCNHPKQLLWMDLHYMMPWSSTTWPLVLWLELYYQWKSYNTRCDHCGKRWAVYRRQKTQYQDDKMNHKTLCPDCQEVEDDYWTEVWHEYWREVL